MIEKESFPQRTHIKGAVISQVSFDTLRLMIEDEDGRTLIIAVSEGTLMGQAFTMKTRVDFEYDPNAMLGLSQAIMATGPVRFYEQGQAAAPQRVKAVNFENHNLLLADGTSLSYGDDEDFKAALADGGVFFDGTESVVVADGKIESLTVTSMGHNGADIVLYPDTEQ